MITIAENMGMVRRTGTDYPISGNKNAIWMQASWGSTRI